MNIIINFNIKFHIPQGNSSRIINVRKVKIAIVEICIFETILKMNEMHKKRICIRTQDITWESTFSHSESLSTIRSCLGESQNSITDLRNKISLSVATRLLSVPTGSGMKWSKPL
ncbi:hypothetical protein V8G54_018899 [Vigna mungo]|uniref:Uncharacterized protein n=1 Tax=Vigna mungo TaxID=3915 RepID=A0AAQ3RUE7_VIGMU